jgi:hypothetical protein
MASSGIGMARKNGTPFTGYEKKGDIPLSVIVNQLQEYNPYSQHISVIRAETNLCIIQVPKAQNPYLLRVRTSQGG